MRHYEYGVVLLFVVLCLAIFSSIGAMHDNIYLVVILVANVIIIIFCVAY